METLKALTTFIDYHATKPIQSREKVIVLIVAIWNDVCLQNTSKSPSYHVRRWHLL